MSSMLKLSFFSRSTTITRFILDGKTDFLKDKLKSTTRYGASIWKHCFNNHVGNGSSSQCLHVVEPISSIMCGNLYLGEV